MAGQKETARDPESGKTKTQPKGLGKWRCSGCKKLTKVTVGKSVPREGFFSVENGATVILNAMLVEVPNVP
jgi:hypothetical protein